MLKFLAPGPIPGWLPIAVSYSHEDRRHFACIASRCIVWRRKGILHVRPLIGGVVLLVECGSSDVKIQPRKVRLHDRPLIPLMRGAAVWVQRFGYAVSAQHHISSTSS